MSLEKAIAALAPHYGRVTVKHQQLGEKSVTTFEFGEKRKPVIDEEKYRQAAEMTRKVMEEIWPASSQKKRPPVKP